MIALLVFILATGAVNAIVSPCPVFFFVVPYKLYVAMDPSQLDRADYGIYFMKNGTQFPPPFYLPKDTIKRMTEIYHCAIFEAIVTDSPQQFDPDIQDWIPRECKRLSKEPSDCFRPKFSENKVTSIIPLSAPEDTPAPTYSPTTRTAIDFGPDKCTERPDLTTCALDGKHCHWFNVLLGCQTVDFCKGLGSRDGCIARKQYCLWRNFKCISRSIPP